MEQFEYELTINEARAQMVQKIDDDICKVWEIKKEDVLKSMKSTQILDQLKQWLKEQLTFIVELPAYTKEIYIEHKIMENLYNDILEKIQELEETIHDKEDK